MSVIQKAVENSFLLCHLMTTYTIGKEFQQRNSFFRSMTIWDFFYFWIAFVTCLFCTWNRSHEKWIWVVDFRLWILIQPCYASRAPNALAQIAFPWEKKHTEFCHMSKWKKESKKKSETPKHWIATKDYLLNEFLMVPFIFRKKKKNVHSLSIHFPHSKFHSEFFVQCLKCFDCIAHCKAYINAKISKQYALKMRKCRTIYYQEDLMHFLLTAKSITANPFWDNNTNKNDPISTMDLFKPGNSVPWNEKKTEFVFAFDVFLEKKWNGLMKISEEWQYLLSLITWFSKQI